MALPLCDQGAGEVASPACFHRDSPCCALGTSSRRLKNVKADSEAKKKRRLLQQAGVFSRHATGIHKHAPSFVMAAMTASLRMMTTTKQLRSVWRKFCLQRSCFSTTAVQESRRRRAALMAKCPETSDVRARLLAVLTGIGTRRVGTSCDWQWCSDLSCKLQAQLPLPVVIWHLTQGRCISAWKGASRMARSAARKISEKKKTLAEAFAEAFLGEVQGAGELPKSSFKATCLLVHGRTSLHGEESQDMRRNIWQTE